MYKYITEKDGTQHLSTDKFSDDWYMKAFLQNASLRQSCLSCSAKRACGSDITLGDFWKIQRYDPEVPVERGVSAVIANTDSGISAIEGIAPRLLFGYSNYAAVMVGNPALESSASPYPRRNRFLQAVVNDMPMRKLMKKWSFRPSTSRRVGGKIKSLKNLLRRR
jgi:hypothetical protein